TQTSPPPTAAVTTTTTKATTTAAQIEVESVKCHSCGFTEECTPAYISRVRDRYQGRWICGLCVEAVKDEVLRSDRLISTEEALNRHVSFCNKFRSSSPVSTQSLSWAGFFAGVWILLVLSGPIRAVPCLASARLEDRLWFDLGMMHMTLYWGIKVTLLFDSWKTDSWLSYLLTLLACCLFAAFYQYLEDRRIRLKALASARNQQQLPTSSLDAPLLSSIKRRVAPAKFATAVLFGINSAIGYLLMLAIMSFNGGVFLAIVVGLAFGYMLFRSGDEEVVVVDNPCACA
ncbi:hypothetical protein Tsubulata_007668, partial [Turnera subulata]